MPRKKAAVTNSKSTKPKAVVTAKSKSMTSKSSVVTLSDDSSEPTSLRKPAPKKVPAPVSKTSRKSKPKVIESSEDEPAPKKASAKKPAPKQESKPNPQEKKETEGGSKPTKSK